jgi:lysyl-tRNA synthetase class 2
MVSNGVMVGASIRTHYLFSYRGSCYSSRVISRETAELRAGLMSAVGSFFHERDYLAVDPPVMARTLIPESHIEVFRTDLVSPYHASEPRFLTPSPEIFLKRLLAAGFGSLYSIGKAFRNAESISRIHNPEFTMVEWYGVDTDADSQLRLTAELLRDLTRRFPAAPGAAGLASEPLILTMAEAFERFAGVPVDALGSDDLRRALGAVVEARDGENTEDLFHRILVDRVEPALPADRPVFLTDYPAFVRTLAARRPHPAEAFAERWELYVWGMEIANCYTEERDPARLSEFLLAEGDAKRGALVPHPVADDLAEFASAPPVSGVALGFDRLLMALSGIDEITGVIFCS